MCLPLNNPCTQTSHIGVTGAPWALPSWGAGWPLNPRLTGTHTGLASRGIRRGWRSSCSGSGTHHSRLAECAALSDGRHGAVWCGVVSLLVRKLVPATAPKQRHSTTTFVLHKYRGRGQVKHTAVHSRERWRLNSPHAATPIAHFERDQPARLLLLVCRRPLAGRQVDNADAVSLYSAAHALSRS